MATHWVTELRNARADTFQIVDSAAELAGRPRRSFEVLLAFDTIPNRPIAEQTKDWVSQREVITWLRANGFATAGVRRRCGRAVGNAVGCGVRRGVLTWRCRMASWWRRTWISVSLSVLVVGRSRSNVICR
ncbi:hypothetical protein GCM10029964_091340 [Kibdelosporangium lantanae]